MVVKSKTKETVCKSSLFCNGVEIASEKIAQNLFKCVCEIVNDLFW